MTDHVSVEVLRIIITYNLHAKLIKCSPKQMRSKLYSFAWISFFVENNSVHSVATAIKSIKFNWLRSVRVLLLIYLSFEMIQSTVHQFLVNDLYSSCNVDARASCQNVSLSEHTIEEVSLKAEYNSRNDIWTGTTTSVNAVWSIVCCDRSGVLLVSRGPWRIKGPRRSTIIAEDGETWCSAAHAHIDTFLK